MTDNEAVSAFTAGASIMIETADGGLEAGELVGAGMFGLLFRATHRLTIVPGTDEDRAEMELDEDDEVEVTKSEMEPLARTVLTMLPWQEVKKIELASELWEDAALREFRNSLDLSDSIDGDEDLNEVVDLDEDGIEDTGPDDE